MEFYDVGGGVDVTVIEMLAYILSMEDGTAAEISKAHAKRVQFPAKVEAVEPAAGVSVALSMVR
jgi:pyruvate/2-oxoglutarate dehydrogenase complex dihydrolipoamide dehydrogenase (E3) component